MKHTKFYGGLCALVMILLTSLSAAAQELTVKTVSFLKPGEKGVLAIGLKNASEVDGFQAKIYLPEGITFVQSEENEKRFAVNETERTKDWMLFLQKSNESKAVLLGLGDAIAAGEGDVVTFDVNVDENYTGANEIKLEAIEITEPNHNLLKPENVTGLICSTEDQMFVNGSIAPITVGQPQTVSFTLSFDKVMMNAARFFVELPEGLEYVDESAAVGSLCGNHVAAFKNNRVYTILPKNIAKDFTFLANEGELGSFQVVANEKFVNGSKIRITGVCATSWDENNKTTEYYAEDFDIEVTLDTTTGINGLESFSEAADGIYQLNGVRTDKMQRGVNVVVKNGKAIKVVKK